MANISLRIDDDIKQRLTRVAELAGMSPSAIVREAIYDRMEELEDFHSEGTDGQAISLGAE